MYRAPANPLSRQRGATSQARRSPPRPPTRAALESPSPATARAAGCGDAFFPALSALHTAIQVILPARDRPGKPCGGDARGEQEGAWEVRPRGVEGRAGAVGRLACRVGEKARVKLALALGPAVVKASTTSHAWRQGAG